jgi:ATP-dependent DNA helicase RecG
MRPDEKARVMKDFKEGRVQVLVSTVVIEVGVDVPNATLMLIEDAEKFGLAQLHQLRGRVGRGDEESFCILFSGTESEESVERLTAFAATESGFKIAEKDLGMRGAGDVVGEKQHGLPDLKIGDFVKDAAVLSAARDEAAALVAKDPKLALPEHAALRRALKERFGVTEDKKLAALAS